MYEWCKSRMPIAACGCVCRKEKSMYMHTRLANYLKSERSDSIPRAASCQPEKN